MNRQNLIILLVAISMVSSVFAKSWSPALGVSYHSAPHPYEAVWQNWSDTHSFTLELGLNQSPELFYGVSVNYMAYPQNTKQPPTIDAGTGSTEAYYGRVQAMLRVSPIAQTRVAQYVSPYFTSGLGVTRETLLVTGYSWSSVYENSSKGDFGFISIGLGLELMKMRAVFGFVEYRIDQELSSDNISSYPGYEPLRFEYISTGIRVQF